MSNWTWLLGSFGAMMSPVWKQGRGGLIATVAVATIAVGAAALGPRIIDTGGGGSPNFSGTFDCYGATPNCTGLTPASCTQTISAPTLLSVISSASAGAVICLNSGTYTGGTLNAVTKASDVTVQPASGAAVVIGGITFNGVTHIHLTGVGGGGSTLTLGGSILDTNTSYSCSANLTFDHIVYTDGAFFWAQQACAHDLNLLWDHNRHEDSGVGGEETRIRIVAVGSAPSTTNGLTISNSLISGVGGGSACADGIDFAGSPYGTVIGPGNEFTGINQGTCDPTHVDPIQGLGSEYTVIVGNWFHDNGSGSGGILSDVEPNLTIKNNVFASTGYPHSILVKGAQNNTITHNVIVGDIDWQLSNGGQSGSGNLVQNNVCGNINLDGSSTTYTANHNVGSGLGCDIAGPPIYQSNPATGYYHYVLASNSPGYNAGSDGKSVGICSTCGG